MNFFKNFPNNRGQFSRFISLLICAIFAAGILIFIASNFGEQNMQIDFGHAVNFNDNWHVYLLVEEENGVLKTVMTNTLPQTLSHDAVFSFISDSQSAKVYVCDKVSDRKIPIYYCDATYGSLAKTYYGTYINLMGISNEFAGQKITIELTSSVNTVPARDFLLGDRSGVIWKIFSDNFSILLSVILLFIFSVILILLTFFLKLFFLKNSSLQFQYSTIIYLGIFMLLVSFWMLTNSQLLQFVFANRTCWYLFSYFAFMLLPVPILFYINNLSKNKHKLMLVMPYILMLNFIFQGVLYLLGITTMKDTLIITHILLISTFICVIVTLWGEMKQNPVFYLKVIFYGIVSLLFCSFIELILYYFRGTLLNAGFFRLGIILLIIALIISATAAIVEVVQASYEMKKSNQLLELHMRSLKKQEILNQRNNDEMKILRHDMRHNIRILKGLLISGNTEKMLDFLDDMDKLSFQPAAECYCKNSFINSVSSQYISYAKSNSIKVDAKISLPEVLPTSEKEFAVLFANLLENAINSCLKIEDADSRAISVVTRLDGEQIFLEISNTYAVVPTFDLATGWPISDTSSTNTLDNSDSNKEHGLGMQSIHAFVRKNQGSIEFFLENGRFKVLLIV